MFSFDAYAICDPSGDQEIPFFASPAFEAGARTRSFVPSIPINVKPDTP
jgi:hypothetical protein